MSRKPIGQCTGNVRATYGQCTGNVRALCAPPFVIHRRVYQAIGGCTLGILVWVHVMHFGFQAVFFPPSRSSFVRPSRAYSSFHTSASLVSSIVVVPSFHPSSRILHNLCSSPLFLAYSSCLFVIFVCLPLHLAIRWNIESFQTEFA